MTKISDHKFHFSLPADSDERIQMALRHLRNWFEIIVLTGLIALLLIAAGVLMQSACTINKPQAVFANQLNVLFVITDDLGTTLGCYDHDLVKTPNLDRLASRGAKFTRAYCQFPLCNPSRTSLLSGKRPKTTKIVDNVTHPKTFLPNGLFLPEHFKASGYFIARVGKVEHNHFTTPVIDWDFADTGFSEDADLGKENKMPNWEASELDDDQLPDGQNIRRAIELLRERASKPFFLAVGLRRPHRPLIAPKKYFDLYRLEDIALPPDALIDNGIPLQEKREALRAYFACVSYIDAQMGVLLDELDRLGLSENTVIVFTSDHGVDLGQRNRFVQKQSLYENVVRVPLIFAGPQIPQGLSLNQFAELVDLYPTLADLCGLPQPSGVEGLSLRPLFADPTQSWRKAVYADNRARGEASRSVRTETFRFWQGKKVPQSLYDLRADPDEKHDLSSMRDYQDELRQLKRLLKRGWREALPSP